MKISSLLNSEPLSTGTRRSFANQCTPSGTKDASGRILKRPRNQACKKAKEIKDAPRYEEGEPIGPVSYPPFEADNEHLEKQYERFSISPRNGIAKYPRNVPYSSDKKQFQAKTGRDSFNVFQYTFRYQEANDDMEYLPKETDPHDWRVVWDYNIGLVRITPFFKSQQYQKTIPAKAINTNPGLIDLCHSITGGALVAQGYWMPFEAAKALAATFCWKIRYALVPVFGPDFIDCCIDPADPIYKRFSIDPFLIQRCSSTMEAIRAKHADFRPRRLRARRPVLPSSTSPSSQSSSSCASESDLDIRSIPTKRSRRHEMHDSSNSEARRGLVREAAVPYQSGFTAVNRPHSQQTRLTTSTRLASDTSSPAMLLISGSKTGSPIETYTCATDVQSSTVAFDKASSNSHASSTGRRAACQLAADEAQAAQILLDMSLLETKSATDGFRG